MLITIDRSFRLCEMVRQSRAAGKAAAGSPEPSSRTNHHTATTLTW